MAGIDINNILDNFDDNPLQDAVGNGKRLLNYLLDSLFIIILIPITLFILALLIILIANNPYIFESDLEEKIWANTCIFISVTFPFIYYLTCEYLFSGRSPAKFITRTRVVTIEGGIPSTSTLVKRTLARYIPFEFISFLGGSPQGLHDKLSKTVVVSNKGVAHNSSTL